MPKITVYITNYNYGKYIKQAIESVLEQTLQDFELIIIDDGSTDDSKAIIEQYKDLPQVKIIYQQNRGLNITNNIALRASKGKYIMRLDADDYLEPSALLVMSNLLEQDPELGLVFPDYYMVDANGKILEVHQRHDFKHKVSLLDQAAHGACTMIRTAFLSNLGGYNESYTCQDGYELWVKFTQNYKVQNVNVPLFYYRQHGNNLTSNEQRILRTRARINANYIEEGAITIRGLGVIPVRDGKQSIGFKMLKGQSLLDRKIQDAIACKQLKTVVVTAASDYVRDYLEEHYKDEPKLQFIHRPEALTRLNTTLTDSISHVLDAVDPDGTAFDAIAILALEYPLLSTFQMDDAINTMFLFGSDSLISVRLENSMFFQHHGEGMIPILNQNRFTKLEREALYRHVGGITVVKRPSFDKEQESLLVGKVGHMIVDQVASSGIFSKLDLEIAAYLMDYEQRS